MKYSVCRKSVRQGKEVERPVELFPSFAQQEFDAPVAANVFQHHHFYVCKKHGHTQELHKGYRATSSNTLKSDLTRCHFSTRQRALETPVEKFAVYRPASRVPLCVLPAGNRGKVQAPVARMGWRYSVYFVYNLPLQARESLSRCRFFTTCLCKPERVAMACLQLNHRLLIMAAPSFSFQVFFFCTCENQCSISVEGHL